MKIAYPLGVDALPKKQQRNPPMLTDPEALQHIRDSWKTVRILQARINTIHTPTIFSVVPVADNFREVAESLLLLFATSVLEDTLEKLCDQGVFAQTGLRGFERLMKASIGKLCWQNFGKIQEIKNRRNKVAHERAFPPSDKCAEYLNAIAKQLLAWDVLEHDFKGTYEVSFRPTSE
jgi:hypothetical protein